MARKRKSRALANGHAPVSAMALARHFGVAHQYIHALVAQAVIERRPDGKFDETTCRLRYIAHLRAQNKRSPLAAADAEHSAAKAALIRIRIAQAKRELVKRADVNDLIDRMCGVMLTAFGSLPAMCAAPNDLMTRRRVEAVVHKVRKDLAAVATEMADAAGEPELAPARGVAR